MKWWNKIIYMVWGDCYITDNFQVSEFDCRDGTPYPPLLVEKELLRLCKNLEVLRENLGSKATVILSGYRTPGYNKKVGGSKKSQHIEGRAADIKVKGVSARRVAEKIERLIKDGKMDEGGVGSYPSWTHYDVRGRKARWRK